MNLLLNKENNILNNKEFYINNGFEEFSKM